MNEMFEDSFSEVLFYAKGLSNVVIDEFLPNGI